MSGPLSRVSTIGILGGGQLGRMLAIEAKRRGYRTVVRSDEAPGGSASQVSDAEFAGPYDDAELNQAFADAVDVVTSEFENLPPSLLEWLAKRVPVRPGAASLAVCQNREREKRFLEAQGFVCAPFHVVTSASECAVAVAAIGRRCVLKSAAFGYDGKGQAVIDRADDASAAWNELDVERAVLEAWIPFDREISVVGARGHDGSWTNFGPFENVHVRGILDHTIAPASVSAEMAAEAVLISRHIATALDHVGTIGVEFFAHDDGWLVVNEIAPRPHNSGHHTIDSCATSQFGLQLDATIGAPFGDTTQHSTAMMVNLLGDLWAGGEPDWAPVADHPRAYLHLYGKASARPGRKMGHFTVLGESTADALRDATELRARLAGGRFRRS